VETAGGVDISSGGNGGASASSFETSSYTSGQQGNASLSGFESGQGVGFAGDFSSSYESNSVSAEGGNAGFAAAGFGGSSASGYESNSGSVGGVSGVSGINNGNIDPAIAAFTAADLNKDGGLDPNEFRQFLSTQLHYR
jgi:hypothetical protein